jgi:hypothetical protein
VVVLRVENLVPVSDGRGNDKCFVSLLLSNMCFCYRTCGSYIEGMDDMNWGEIIRGVGEVFQGTSDVSVVENCLGTDDAGAFSSIETQVAGSPAETIDRLDYALLLRAVMSTNQNDQARPVPEPAQVLVVVRRPRGTGEHRGASAAAAEGA